MSDFVPLTGEPLALDLINTRVKPPGADWVDTLGTLSDLDLWLRLQQPRLAVGGGRLTRADLDAVHQFRDDVADAVHLVRAGHRPAAEGLERINEALHAAPAVGKLRWDSNRLVHEPIRPPGPGNRLLTRLAEATADLLTDPRVVEIRDCAMPDCVMLFYPNRPTRKWCYDALCGNRARAARHYQRHRARKNATT